MADTQAAASQNNFPADGGSFAGNAQEHKHMEFNMKQLLLGASLFLALATAAEAKCSKAALSGNWVIYPISGSSGPAVTISGGAFTVSGTPYTISTFGSNCKGAGTFGTAPSVLPILVTSESVKSTSTAKPNMLTISIFSGPITVTQQLVRK